MKMAIFWDGAPMKHPPISTRLLGATSQMITIFNFQYLFSLLGKE
jgi:hypothetical protein